MKRTLFSLALILIFAATVYAGPPEKGQLNFTVGGGFNVPTEEEASNGFALNSSLGYHLSPTFVLGGEVFFLGYGTENGTDEFIGNFSLSQHFFEYMGSAKYYLSRTKYAPYFKGFVGGFSYGLDGFLGGFSLDETYSDFQFGGGIGLIVRGDKESNLYLEALVHSLQGDEESAQIFTFTMGMDVNIGL